MRLKEVLKFMFILACIVTVGQILFVSTIAAISDIEFSIYAHQLYHYPLMAFSSVIPTLIFINSERSTINGWKIRVIFHFFFTAIIVVGSSIYHIYYLLRAEVFVVVLISKALLFIAIYTGTWWAFDRHQQILSDELNKRINEFNDD